MKIKNISIEGFGLFDGRFDLTLPGDIALIVGDNETGKSTLLKAVGAILFGFKNENERAIFAPNGIGSPRRGSLDIETAGRLHRLSREFTSNHARIESLGEDTRILFDGSAKPGGRTEEKETYDNLMMRLIGIDSSDLFHNSVFVEQNRLRTEMEGVVRQIASGTSLADYSVALDNLVQACEELTLEVPWGRKRKPRRIERLEVELRGKEQALDETRRDWTDIGQLGDRLTSVESELSEVNDYIGRLEAWEQDISSFAVVWEEAGRLEDQVNDCRDEMREIETLTNELSTLSGRIRDTYSDFETLPEQTETDMATLIQLKTSENELEKRYRETEMEAPRFALHRLSVAGIIIGLLVAGIGAMLPGLLLKIAAIGMGLGAFAWSLFSAVLSMRSKKSAHFGKLDEIKSQMDILRNQSASIEKKYPVLKRMTPSDVQRGLREFRQLHQEKEKKREALKQHPQFEEIEPRYNSLSNEFVVASGKVDALKSRRPRLKDIEQGGQVGKAVEEARTEIRSLGDRRGELTTEQGDLKVALATAEAKQTVSEETLEENISELRSELEQLKLSREAHLIAIKVLEESISEFRSSHLSRIEKKTSDLLSRIAGAEYRVQLDENLDPLGVEQSGHLFAPAQLSQGTRDQLYFALRLASLEEISGDKRLPILLDDPFVNFDENRLAATLDMLATLSETHQVIVLTHDRRLCQWRESACILERKG